MNTSEKPATLAVSLIAKSNAAIFEEFPLLQVLYSPDIEPRTRLLVSLATMSIWMMCFTFDNEYLAVALKAAVARGVDVRLLCDYRQLRTPSTKNQHRILLSLIAAKVKVAHWQPHCGEWSSAHEKSVMVDKARLVIGSANFTYNATVNCRDSAVILADQAALHAHGEHFEEAWSESEGITSQLLSYFMDVWAFEQVSRSDGQAKREKWVFRERSADAYSSASATRPGGVDDPQLGCRVKKISDLRPYPLGSFEKQPVGPFYRSGDTPKIETTSGTTTVQSSLSRSSRSSQQQSVGNPQVPSQDGVSVDEAVSSLMEGVAQFAMRRKHGGRKKQHPP